MIYLLDNRKSDAQEHGMEPVKKAENEKGLNGHNTVRSEASGSDLCIGLLSLYDNVQSQCSEASEDDRTLVSAVLGSLLAVSHTAKNAALQGEVTTEKRVNEMAM